MSEQPAEPEIASKSEFARLCNVSPGRVTQWITEGKVYGEAIVGEGRTAQIRVAVARAQLRRHLDIGQRLGNGLSTKLDGPPAQPTEAAAPALPLPPPQPRTDPVEEQIKAARLEGLSRDNRKKAEEEAARAGRYTLTEAVKKQIGRALARIINMLDGWLAEISAKASARFSIPQRDMLHFLRSEFRLFRANAAAALRDEADELPALIEDEVSETEGKGEEESEPA
ncbi:MAG TPA: hypothetical protein VKW08_07905 [Xanthobacteraceae bacterium]|jgi:hypothetical protein|nr:hypothetical protein [Xanthobacteraceae bacterium]